jgi:hypothetical protein
MSNLGLEPMVKDLSSQIMEHIRKLLGAVTQRGEKDQMTAQILNSLPLVKELRAELQVARAKISALQNNPDGTCLGESSSGLGKGTEKPIGESRLTSRINLEISEIHPPERKVTLSEVQDSVNYEIAESDQKRHVQGLQYGRRPYASWPLRAGDNLDGAYSFDDDDDDDGEDGDDEDDDDEDEIDENEVENNPEDDDLGESKDGEAAEKAWAAQRARDGAELSVTPDQGEGDLQPPPPLNEGQGDGDSESQSNLVPVKQVDSDVEKEGEDSDEEILEVDELTINAIVYYTDDQVNGSLFECLESGEIGRKVGHFENGDVFFS